MNRIVTEQATLVWFRQDLRIQDNPALYYAAAQGKVLPVYIFDTKHPGQWQQGGASRWWLHQSLIALNERLNGALRIFQGDPLDLIPALLQTAGIKRMAWNRCYQPWQIRRDGALEVTVKDLDIEVHTHNGSLLWEPWEVLKKDGTPYKVFTPYFRKGCMTREAPRFPLPAPQSLQTLSHAIKGEGLDSLALMPTVNWYPDMACQWQPGEEGAGDRLSEFVTQRLVQYKRGRDRPDIQATSRLSPHLHFGELSPNQAWYVTQNAPLSSSSEDDRDCFLSELGWREFSHYLLYHWPTLPRDNFQEKFDRFAWRHASEDLEAWQRGTTGIPMVDAGMRELWQTGYMHNRVRMIVGSFLVKNLRLHWHLGQAWFWDTLVDADLASNSASWQWIAGSGADAAPYFRIFNPVTQGQRFDPDGVYVKRFCPELSGLPDKYIHCPWMAPALVLAQSGVVLGSTYPQPIVDLKVSRQQALSAFAALKNHSSSVAH